MMASSSSQSNEVPTSGPMGVEEEEQWEYADSSTFRYGRLDAGNEDTIGLLGPAVLPGKQPEQPCNKECDEQAAPTSTSKNTKSHLCILFH
jgi:hypothetical protein